MREVTLTDCVKEWLKINPALIDKHELQFRGYSFTLVSLEDKEDKFKIKFHTKIKLPKTDIGPSRLVVWRCTKRGLGTALKFEIAINDSDAELLDGRARVLQRAVAADPAFFDVLRSWLRSIIVV